MRDVSRYIAFDVDYLLMELSLMGEPLNIK
jgi:hypothetical protein